MTAATPGKARRLRRALFVFTRRVLNRLGSFPFAFALLLLNAAQNLLQLWRAIIVVRAGDATTSSKHLPRNALLWVDRWVSEQRGQPHPCDACLLLPREFERADLHEVFSVMLAFPRFRSIGFYWDAVALEDDLPLWGRRPGLSSQTKGSFDDFARLPVARLEQLFRAGHAELALPVAVTREAQNFLKRQARAAPVVVLNLPAQMAALADEITGAQPEIRFFDMASAADAVGRGNCQLLSEQGLTLHERMALVQAADGYVGRFDEMGCAALISGRATLVFGAGIGDGLDEIIRAGNVVWLPDSLAPTAALREALQFVLNCVEVERGKRQ